MNDAARDKQTQDSKHLQVADAESVSAQVQTLKNWNSRYLSNKPPRHPRITEDHVGGPLNNADGGRRSPGFYDPQVTSIRGPNLGVSATRRPVRSHLLQIEL